LTAAGVAVVSGAELSPLELQDTRKTLFEALIEARARYGGRKPAFIDSDDKVLTYDDLVRAALALGHALKKGNWRWAMP